MPGGSFSGLRVGSLVVLFLPNCEDGRTGPGPQSSEFRKRRPFVADFVGLVKRGLVVSR